MALSVLPAGPARTERRHVRRAHPIATAPSLDMTVLPTWSSDPAGRLRGILSWAQALAVARSPIERVVPPPGSSSRTDAALDLGEAGMGPGRRVELETRLTDRDDRLSMSAGLLNCLSENQIQRIATAEDRATLDDRRATPNPGEEALVASPDRPGDALERNDSYSEPGRGEPGAEPAAEASIPTEPREGEAGPIAKLGGERFGVREARAGSAEVPGVAEPEPPGHPDGDVGRRAATVPVPAWQRPDVAEGHASVPAQRRHARTRDDRTGRYWNDHFHRSYTSASLVSGRSDDGSGDGRSGDGRGLSGRGRAARSRGGDRAGPTWISFRTGDPRFLRYFRQIHRRIDPLWRGAFPDALRVAHEQGLVIVGFVLHRNGGVSGLRVLRRSGYPEFDRNVLAAVRQAAPFLPIPHEITEDVLHVSAPFHFSNPMF